MNTINLDDAAVVNIIAKKANEDTVIFTFTDSSNAPINLGSNSFSLDVFDRKDGELIQSAAGVIGGGSNNQVSVSLISIVNKLAIKAYWYRLVRTFPDSKKRVSINGDFTVKF